jgi:hypothetical protein
MKDTYRYYILAYEDARQKRPIKNMSTAGPPSSPTALRRSGEPNCSPKSTPMGGSTSTSTTEGTRGRRRPRRPPRGHRR